MPLLMLWGGWIPRNGGKGDDEENREILLTKTEQYCLLKGGRGSFATGGEAMEAVEPAVAEKENYWRMRLWRRWTSCSSTLGLSLGGS